MVDEITATYCSSRVEHHGVDLTEKSIQSSQPLFDISGS
jgi:hypothetical protein